MGKKLEAWVIAFLVLGGFSSIGFVIGGLIAHFVGEPVVAPTWAVAVIGIGFFGIFVLSAWMMATGWMAWTKEANSRLEVNKGKRR